VSKIYQRKLARVQDERDTAEETVAYARDNWYTKSLFNEAGFDGRTLDGILQLAESRLVAGAKIVAYRHEE
jgi:hypothetical protein